MTDRELLELAAKAAGYCVHIWGTKGEENCARTDTNQPTKWNPLADDGDALRLAVKLSMDINAYPMSNEVGAIKHGTNGGSRHFEYTHVDAYAATRRAIVRAAAEIGKGSL